MGFMKFPVLTVFIFWIIQPLLLGQKLVKFKIGDYGKKTEWEELLIRDEGYSIAVDKNERVYICDRKNNQVHILDREGTYIKSFGQKGQGPGDFYAPTDVDIFYDKVLVSENLMSKTLALHKLDGEFIRKIYCDFAPYISVLTKKGKLIYVAKGAIRTKGLLNHMQRVVAVKGENSTTLKESLKSNELYIIDYGKAKAFIHDAANYSGDLFVGLTTEGLIVSGDSDTNRISVLNEDLKEVSAFVLKSSALNSEVKVKGYFDKCKDKTCKLFDQEMPPGARKFVLNKYRSIDIPVKQLPYYRRLQTDGNGNIVVFLNDYEVTTKKQKVQIYTTKGELVKELIIDTTGFELDYNSELFISYQKFFAFAGNSIFAILPKEDEEGEINYRVYRARI